MNSNSPRGPESVPPTSKTTPPPQAGRPFDRDRYRAQIEAYRCIQPSYAILASSLAAVLEQASVQLGLRSIVQARAKTIASFAEKITRPGKECGDPLRELVDLCGARVITQTSSGVAAICRFVEQHFAISWPESGDKLESLGTSEFGYLSRHYAVTLLPGVFSTDIVPAELIERGLKAEIQVRTILQHAWADIHHDRGYKNRFPLPRRWQRGFARLAAVLEAADRDFEATSAGLDEYASSYGAYLSPERVREEIDKLSVVLELSPEPDPGVAHQLARLAMTLEDWDRSIAVLTPHAQGKRAPLLRDLGISLCKRHANEPEGPEFARGQVQLERAIELDPSDVDAWSSLGGTWRQRESACENHEKRRLHRQEAKACYRRAFEIDPSASYPLANYIEFEIADHPAIDIVQFFRPSIEAARRRCQAQAEVGINFPWVFFDLAKFNLMLDRPFEALGDYARGVVDCTAPFFLDSALRSLATLEPARLQFRGIEWCRGLLQLAKAWRFHQPDPAGPAPAQGAAPLKAPVVIVTGSCRGSTDESLHATILAAFRGFQGTILCGGTELGVCGLVGDIQEHGGAGVRTVGYLPGVLPANTQLDARYTEHRRTAGQEFSPLEPLQYWADLYSSNVPVPGVRVVSLGGGPISVAECQMALAFGVRVALVELDGSTDVDRALSQPAWADQPALERIPAHADALRAFLGFG